MWKQENQLGGLWLSCGAVCGGGKDVGVSKQQWLINYLM